MRVAAFQRFPIHDDPARTGESLLHDLLWAERQGVELALFPECHLLGHSYDPAAIARRALERDGAVWRALLARLAPLSVTAVIGAFERRGEAILNSARVVEAGRIAGSAAKAHPNEPGVTAGADAPVFTRSGVRFGVAICYDANFAEPARRLSESGAELLCYPLSNMMRPETAAKWRRLSLENLQARARQTGCWVMSADVIGRHGGRVSHGCTAIVRPDGEVAARVAEDVEGAALFDLPLPRLRSTRVRAGG
jgi:predicted amidohydrolase